MPERFSTIASILGFSGQVRTKRIVTKSSAICRFDLSHVHGFQTLGHLGVKYADIATLISDGGSATGLSNGSHNYVTLIFIAGQSITVCVLLHVQLCLFTHPEQSPSTTSTIDDLLPLLNT